ncbi:phage tail protein I [Streptomyces sp. NPDC057638]|uniref:phage tail protein I n=1 Tax=Streptomyces sp. NPDC057638 TaxID=3346190 RepID=UPI003690655E
MSCSPHPATFRLLDAYVGWDPEPTGTGVVGVTGLDDPDGLRLARRGGTPDGPSRADLLPWFPDRRLAPGCRSCSWYLLTPGAPWLRRRDSCGDWTPLWPAWCLPEDPRGPYSVAARGHRLAVVARGRVLVWRNEGEHLAGVITVRRPRWAALAPGDTLLVATAGTTVLRRYTTAGRFLGLVRTGAPGEVTGLRTGPGHTVWLLTDDDGVLRIHRGTGREFAEVTFAELRAALAPSGLVAAGDDGFCLREDGPEGELTRCFDWGGAPRESMPSSADERFPEGRVLTRLIDSGISRCRWHRVRVDADLPPGTTLSVAVVVSEDGHYAPTDWQHGAASATDFLIDQPPGRFLRLRLTLTGDGAATPVVRRIRLDFPRVTSADLLPPAFRQDPVADDFTERFLSLFDASLADLDRVIERYPALLDPAGVPDRVLPWLAGLLGLSFEAGWSAATRRELIATAPALYRRRGTPWALREAVRIVFGTEPVVDELPADRRWAHLRPAAGAPERAGRPEGLGSVRLFGRSSTRFRLDGSALGAAPLRAFGDPGADPLTAHAHRFRVLLPAGAADEGALRRLVSRQAPAHTVGSVRTGGAGFVVGSRSTVGVDTAFVPLPPPVLGGGHGLRLGRDAVLRPGRRGARRGVSVGALSAVGVHTQVS